MAATLAAAVGCTLAPPPTAAPRATPTPTESPTPSVTPTVGEASPTSALPLATPAPIELPAPTAGPRPTQALAATAAPSPPPTATSVPTPTSPPTSTKAPLPTPPPSSTATSVPTSTPMPTATQLPTSTPVPTLSPQAIEVTEALVPSWLDNGAELTAFLLDLKRTSPEASSLFESMGWVEDGIGSSTSGRVLQEVNTAAQLRDMWQHGLPGQESFLAVVHKPWLRDELSASESNVVVYINYVLKYDPDLALSLVRMPFLDSVEGKLESRISYLVSLMLYRDSTALQRLLSSEDFDEGITDDHVIALELIVLESEDPEMAAAIDVLPWIQDGTDLSDWEEVNGLTTLAKRSDVFFRAAMDSLEVQDGISPDELIVIQALIRAHELLLWEEEEDAVASVEALPWLLDGVDRLELDGALALMNLGLEDITAFWSAIESDWVQDGVTADEVRMISSLAHR